MSKYKLRISDQITFETAHILPNFDTDYGNFYSHSYILRVEVEGPVINQYGMIMSFEDLHYALQDIVPDHKFVFCKDDVISVEISRILHKYDIPYLELPFMITSENMAKYFIEELTKYIKTQYNNYDNIKITKLEVIGAEDKHSAIIINE